MMLLPAFDGNQITDQLFVARNIETQSARDAKRARELAFIDCLQAIAELRGSIIPIAKINSK
jgi:hypothetical protein